jgi:hypothetical protein
MGTRHRGCQQVRPASNLLSSSRPHFQCQATAQPTRGCNPGLFPNAIPFLRRRTPQPRGQGRRSRYTGCRVSPSSFPLRGSAVGVAGSHCPTALSATGAAEVRERHRLLQVALFITIVWNGLREFGDLRFGYHPQQLSLGYQCPEPCGVWYSNHAATPTFATGSMMSTPPNPAFSDRSSQNFGKCWNQPDARDDEWIASVDRSSGWADDSQKATRSAQAWSSSAKK